MSYFNKNRIKTEPGSFTPQLNLKTDQTFDFINVKQDWNMVIREKKYHNYMSKQKDLKGYKNMENNTQKSKLHLCIENPDGNVFKKIKDQEKNEQFDQKFITKIADKFKTDSEKGQVDFKDPGDLIVQNCVTKRLIHDRISRIRSRNDHNMTELLNEIGLKKVNDQEQEDKDKIKQMIDHDSVNLKAKFFRKISLKFKNPDFKPQEREFKSLVTQPRSKTSQVFPSSRKGGSMNFQNDKLQLFGGWTNQLINSIWVWHISSSEWMEIKGEKGDLPAGRFQHTAVVYRDNLLVLGGCGRQNSSTKSRDNLCDLKSYNFPSNTWTHVVTNQTQDMFTNRKCHAAAIMGVHMIVHGGINDYNKVLNDFWVLELTKFNWTKCNTYFKEDVVLPHLSSHSVVSVQTHELSIINQFNIFNHPESVSDPNGHRKLKIGVQIQGGLKKTEGGDEVSDHLYFVGTGRRIFNFQNMEGFSQRPGPRYEHSMAQDSKNNYLVLVGGKVDPYSENQVSNEVWFFNCETINWFCGRLQGVPFEPRQGHSLSLPPGDTRLFVFGGIGSENFCQCRMVEIQQHQTEVRKMLRENDDIGMIKQEMTKNRLRFMSSTPQKRVLYLDEVDLVKERTEYLNKKAVEKHWSKMTKEKEIELADSSNFDQNDFSNQE